MSRFNVKRRAHVPSSWPRSKDDSPQNFGAQHEQRTHNGDGMKQPKDRMRGVAYDLAIGAIEFGDEPEHFFRKIVREHLPPAKQCGMAAAKKRGVRDES